MATKRKAITAEAAPSPILKKKVTGGDENELKKKTIKRKSTVEEEGGEIDQRIGSEESPKKTQKPSENQAAHISESSEDKSNTNLDNKNRSTTQEGWKSRSTEAGLEAINRDNSQKR
jgi:hypothetical protein